MLIADVPVAKPKKKPLAERVAEREEKKRQEAERRKREVNKCHKLFTFERALELLE